MSASARAVGFWAMRIGTAELRAKGQGERGTRETRSAERGTRSRGTAATPNAGTRNAESGTSNGKQERTILLFRAPRSIHSPMFSLTYSLLKSVV